MKLLKCCFCNKQFYPPDSLERKYCCLECRNEDRKTRKEINPNWKGGLGLTNYSCQVSFRKKYPEKRKAHQAVYWAVRSGKLIRLPCKECGNRKSEAHHKNYDNPLEVEWLCKGCHAKIHYPNTV